MLLLTLIFFMLTLAWRKVVTSFNEIGYLIGVREGIVLGPGIIRFSVGAATAANPNFFMLTLNFSCYC